MPCLYPEHVSLTAMEAPHCTPETGLAGDARAPLARGPKAKAGWGGREKREDTGRVDQPAITKYTSMIRAGLDRDLRHRYSPSSVLLSRPTHTIWESRNCFSSRREEVYADFSAAGCWCKGEG